MTLFNPTGTFSGMRVQIVDAQNQRRTERDVYGPWVRPKVPSKRKGRKGTRRLWKRRNSPHYVMFYREPTNVLIFGGTTIIVTPLQAAALRRETRSV